VQSKSNFFDAIVVGSGITGGWAAKELTEKGLKTLVLERGRDVKHIKDYPTTNLDLWDHKHAGRDTPQEKEEYHIQSQCYAFNEATKHFFVNDAEYPYKNPDDQPFIWIRGYHVGGRSLTWGRQCYRWSDLDFEANSKDGHGVDWPIRYKDIAPWYDYVESFVGVSGAAEGLPQLPDGQFLPPMEMTCVEKVAREAIQKNWPDRLLTIGRAAHLTEQTSRGKCVHRNNCYTGCPTAGYFSSNSATLPAAFETGNLTLRSDSIVQSIIYNEETGKASGVRIIDRLTNETQEYFAKVIFLCASTLGSTYLLMNTKTERFGDDGLGNSSGALGHYLMDHPYGAGANGQFEGFDDKVSYGGRPNGIYVARFRNIKDQHPDFLRGYGMQGGSSRSALSLSAKGVGEKYKSDLATMGPWNMGIGGWGEMLPNYDNKVELDYNDLDQWGMPKLRISCSFVENDHAMRRDMANTAAEMLEAAGAKNVTSSINEDMHPGSCIHEMGTARMGRDPKTSVLNEWNQMHDVPNVFVTDGAAMTSSACQNPSITYMALTARAVDYAVKSLKKGDLS